MSEGNQQPKRAFASWTDKRGSNRTVHVAQALHAELVYSYFRTWHDVRLPAPLRYAFQAWDTVRQLRRIEPTTVVVQSPPFVLGLVGLAYVKLHGANLVIDMHSCTVSGPPWTRFNIIDRFLSRHASVNLCHNHKNIEVLRKWNASNPLMVLSPAMPKEAIYDRDAPVPGFIAQHLRDERLKVLHVNRFLIDDCYREVFETAARMPDVLFLVSGDPNNPHIDRSKLPKNVALIGFVPRLTFMKVMEACDVVLNLTNRPDTLPWSIRECLALGKPFVATGSEVVRRNFEGYGVFTDNSALDLAAKIRKVYDRRNEFVPKMAAYIERDRIRFEKDIRQIIEILRDEQRVGSFEGEAA